MLNSNTNTLQGNANQKNKQRQQEQISRRTPLGRLGTPDDVTGLILFLSSEKADFITGQVLVVDALVLVPYVVWKVRSLLVRLLMLACCTSKLACSIAKLACCVMN